MAVIEAVSLAASLSGTFVSVVECFEYVELGRRFGKDFDKSQARLEALKLQITRWGIAIGTLPDPHTKQHRIVKVDEDTARVADRLLGNILEDTKELEKKSRRYSGDPPASASTGRVDSGMSSSDAIDAVAKTLNMRASSIVAKRIRSMSFQRKTKWALHEKKHFDRLLEDITENLNLLEKLVPQVTKSERELCRIEVEEIKDGQPKEVMELLHDVSKANNDSLLEQAVQEAINSRAPGHTWERTEVDDSVRLEQGDRIASGFTGQAPVGRGNHRFGITIGRGNAEIRQGDIYGQMRA